MKCIIYILYCMLQHTITEHRQSFSSTLILSSHIVNSRPTNSHRFSVSLTFHLPQGTNKVFDLTEILLNLCNVFTMVLLSN